MSNVIVIDSSDEEGNHPPTDKGAHEKVMDNDANNSEIPAVEELFSEFCKLSKDLVEGSDDGEKILKFLRKKHEMASEDYKSSRPYRKMLQNCVSKLEKGSKDVYVHVHNVISTLDKDEKKGIKRSAIAEPKKETMKKRRMTLQAVADDSASNEKNFDAETESAHAILKDTTGSDDPSSSKNTSIREAHCKHKIKKLEHLLKRISMEITKLQNAELSLDDLDQEDTSYIQESKLKRRFMQVYNELCRLNKSSTSTGRVIEKKIKVTASRFSEINHKVERFINNPKRDASFPDFADICHLAKQANIKSHLRLTDAQIRNIAANIFQEVGDKMQKRRQQDFVFEFGCSTLDEQENTSDPASSDSILCERLAKNRVQARQNLDSVIDKYTSIQQKMNEVEPDNPALKEDNESESENEGSDSDINFLVSDSKLANSDEGENGIHINQNDAKENAVNVPTVKQDAESDNLSSLNMENVPYSL